VPFVSIVTAKNKPKNRTFAKKLLFCVVLKTVDAFNNDLRSMIDPPGFQTSGFRRASILHLSRRDLNAILREMPIFRVFFPADREKA